MDADAQPESSLFQQQPIQEENTDVRLAT
jgi:hypothetical protein